MPETTPEQRDELRAAREVLFDIGNNFGYLDESLFPGWAEGWAKYLALAANLALPLLHDLKKAEAERDKALESADFHERLFKLANTSMKQIEQSEHAFRDRAVKAEAELESARKVIEALETIRSVVHVYGLNDHGPDSDFDKFTVAVKILEKHRKAFPR